jgi:hypothetical protein
MTQTRFFQLSLVFPLALWCLGLLIFSLVQKQDDGLLMDNLHNGYRVFVPYLIFAAVLWKLAKNKPYRLLNLMAAVLPIVWGIFFTLFYMLMSYIIERTMDKGHVLCIMAFWATVIAYLAEVIPFLVLVIFKNDFRSETGQTEIEPEKSTSCDITTISRER